METIAASWSHRAVGVPAAKAETAFFYGSKVCCSWVILSIPIAHPYPSKQAFVSAYKATKRQCQSVRWLTQSVKMAHKYNKIEIFWQPTVKNFHSSQRPWLSLPAILPLELAAVFGFSVCYSLLLFHLKPTWLNAQAVHQTATTMHRAFMV